MTDDQVIAVIAAIYQAAQIASGSEGVEVVSDERAVKWASGLYRTARRALLEERHGFSRRKGDETPQPPNA